MAKFNTGLATIDRFLEIKKADEGFYKYVSEECFISLAKCIHPDDLDRLSDAIEELESCRHNMLCFRMKRYDGRYRWILAEIEYDDNLFGGEQLINVNMQDVQALERELNDINNKNLTYAEYFGLLDEFLFEYNIDEDDLKIFMGGNRQNLNVFHGTIKKWQQWHEEEKSIMNGYEKEYENLCRDMVNGVRTFEHEIMSKAYSANHEFELHMVKGKTFIDASRDRKVIGCMSVISGEDKKKQKNFNVESNKDMALDILNKKAITEYIKRLLASKPDYSVHLVIVDLDNFKTVNDTYGHMFGDEVLIAVADILKKAVGTRGVVGRIGGDEMIVVIENVESHSELRGILRTIRSNIEWSYMQQLGENNFTASIGAASYPAHATDYDSLFKIADKMLYRAKDKGKNRYIIYTPAIHGDLLNENAGEVTGTKVLDKDSLILKMLDDFLLQKIVTYNDALNEIADAYGLDEVLIYHGSNEKPIIGITKNGENINEHNMLYVKSETFQRAFNDNGMAVIDAVTNIETIYPEAYAYFVEHSYVSVLIYKMPKQYKEGYVAFYKKSADARKWSDSDKMQLNYIAKILEMSIFDK